MLKSHYFSFYFVFIFKSPANAPWNTMITLLVNNALLISQTMFLLEWFSFCTISAEGGRCNMLKNGYTEFCIVRLNVLYYTEHRTISS